MRNDDLVATTVLIRLGLPRTEDASISHPRVAVQMDEGAMIGLACLPNVPDERRVVATTYISRSGPLTSLAFTGSSCSYGRELNFPAAQSRTSK